MKRTRPVPGSFYRHFTGKICQVRELAGYAGTSEEMVVYQEMVPPFPVLVCPLVTFLEPVDRQEYPDAEQPFCFVEVRPRVSGPAGEDMRRGEGESPPERPTAVRSSRVEDDPYRAVRVPSAGYCPGVGEAGAPDDGEQISDDDLRKILIGGQVEKKLAGRMPDSEIARRGFLILLDERGIGEKRQILKGLGPYMNSLYLSNLAIALDITLEEGSDRQHYETILRCLETWERYEGGRLRQ